jgi:hypothetical protein
MGRRRSEMVSVLMTGGEIRERDERESALHTRISALESQLAAAREENKRRYTHEEVALWLAEYHGRYREKTLTAWVADRRAAADGEGSEGGGR